MAVEVELSVAVENLILVQAEHMSAKGLFSNVHAWYAHQLSIRVCV